MRKPIILVAGLIAAQFMATAQEINSNQQNKKTMTTSQSIYSVNSFFNAFAKGDMDAITNAFHNDCSVTAVRSGSRSAGQLYGTYNGKTGVKEFITNLGNTFNTKAFSIEHMVGDGAVVFVNGKFTHEVKSTGKLFSSDWTLMCVVEDDRIKEYHFFEDSASYLEASKK